MRKIATLTNALWLQTSMWRADIWLMKTSHSNLTVGQISGLHHQLLFRYRLPKNVKNCWFQHVHCELRCSVSFDFPKPGFFLKIYLLHDLSTRQVSSPVNIFSWRYESYKNQSKSAISPPKSNIFSNGLRRCSSNTCLYTIHKQWIESDELDWAVSVVIGRGWRAMAHMQVRNCFWHHVDVSKTRKSPKW